MPSPHSEVMDRCAEMIRLLDSAVEEALLQGVGQTFPCCPCTRREIGHPPRDDSGTEPQVFPSFSCRRPDTMSKNRDISIMLPLLGHTLKSINALKSVFLCKINRTCSIMTCCCLNLQCV